MDRNYWRWVLEHPSIWRSEFRYQLSKLEEDFWFWLSRRIPQRLRYFTFITVGVDAIRDDEVVPEVEYTTLLSRVDSGRN